MPCFRTLGDRIAMKSPSRIFWKVFGRARLAMTRFASAEIKPVKMPANTSGSILAALTNPAAPSFAEAINSMFRWYRNASKCYVYLPDISAGDGEQITWESAFRESRCSAPSYRGEACQPLDLDLVDLEVKGHFRIRKVSDF